MINSSRIFVGKLITVIFYVLVGIYMQAAAFLFTDSLLLIRIISGVVGVLGIIACLILIGSRRIKLSVSARLLVVVMSVMAIVAAYVSRDASMLIFVVFLCSLPLEFWDDYKIFVFNIIAFFSSLLIAGSMAVFGLSFAHINMFHVIGVLVVFIEQLVLMLFTQVEVSNKRRMDEQERSLDDLLKVVEAKCYDAREATKSKSNFLSNMSHEIRTPINSILGMNELILRENKDETIESYANNIDNSGKMLMALINEILDFSKIESGRMELVPVEYELVDLINNLILMMQSRISEKELTFKVEVDEHLPKTLRGDDVRLRQIITNILTNAIKYTKEGSITMRVTGRRVADKVFLHVEVEDTGVGISKEDMPKLFEAFRRINEESNRNVEGTGLGMSITSHLLEMMGSRLGVKSTENVGSNFFFTVKQDIIDAVPIGKFTPEAAPIKKKDRSKALLYAPNAKILFTDDNDMNRTVFAQLLKRTGVQVTLADSGAACLELVKKEKFDLIFMDHMMPVMDGVETFHKLREMEGYTQDVPVVVLTANAITGVKDYYMEEGFSDFLTKPIIPDKLEQTMITFLPDELLESAPDNYVQISGNSNSEMEDKGIELPDVDGLDWNLAKLHFFDPEIMMETLKNFRSTLCREADKLDSFYAGLEDEENLKEYRVLVHSMKSSSALVGIIPLSGCAKVLENAAAAGDRDTIRAMHQVFINLWRSYVDKLETVFPKDEGVDFDVEEFVHHLDVLKEASEILDVDTMDPEFKAIESMSLPFDDEGDVMALGGAVVELDLEQIAEIVDRLKSKCK